jgi:lysozyme
MIDALKRHLEAEEGRRRKPYRCTAGKLTIGIGKNLDDAGLSNDEIDYLLSNDVRRVMGELDRHFPWWRDLSEARQVGLASLCFQLGLQGLMGFRKMLAALQRGDYAEAAQELMDSRLAIQTPARAGRLRAMIERG